MAIFQLGSFIPTIAPSVWVADSAQVIGQVELAEDVNIWFNAVLRGDNEPIRIGRACNVQENCVLHVDQGFPLTLGEGVTIGHQAMLHGCTVGDGSLIGIQAVVLNGARIGRNCLIGAGAIVTEGKEIPDGSMVLGAPGKVVKTLEPAQIERLKQSAQFYVAKAAFFRKELKRL
jgi:carbonic anhydrase/acetyltransferase-like protein (isoleucine patch superfamily)